MGTIKWTPISDVDFRHRDTNDLLFWTAGGAVIGYWNDSGPLAGNWVSLDDEIVEPSHYARIEKP